MTERSSLVHVASGAAVFTLLLHRRVAFLHRTATFFFKYGFIACSITSVILQAILNLQIYIYIRSDFSVTILRLVCRTVFRL